MPTPGEVLDEASEQSQVIDSKYRLIILAAKRSKQLQRGARPRIDIDPTKHKPTRIALEEVIRGKVLFHSVNLAGGPEGDPTTYFPPRRPQTEYAAGGAEGNPSTDIRRRKRPDGTTDPPPPKSPAGTTDLPPRKQEL